MNVTLTTVVTSCDALQVLLKMTDELYASGALSKLRLVDRAKDPLESANIRSIIPAALDVSSGAPIITLDTSIIKNVDPNSHVCFSMTGYQHEPTSFSLSPGCMPVNIFVKGSAGSFVALVPQDRNARGVELVFEKAKCFLRPGKGGGSPVLSIESIDSACEGEGWQVVTLSLSKDSTLKINFGGKEASFQLSSRTPSYNITVSSSSKGSSDFLITKIDPSSFKLKSIVDRSYVAYFTEQPEPAEGIEVVSDLDIVYIEQSGWKKITKGEAVPLVIGDAAHLSALKRFGIFKETDIHDNIHYSFLNRAKGVLDIIKFLEAEDVKMSLPKNSSIVIRNCEAKVFSPALFCGIDTASMRDKEILNCYLKLTTEGPQGRSASNLAIKITSHFEALLNSSDAEMFLSELVEVMPLQKREYLFKLLQRFLS